jgi:hypothetical protein
VLGLIVAAALLLGWDPGLAFDVGFQLSVAATAGLILLSPSIEARLGWLPRSIRGQVAIAVAAQVATLPILVGTFQRVSVVSLPANVLAAPTIVPIMVLGVGLAALGWLPGFDMLLAWAAWGATSVLLGIIEGAAALPGAVLAVGQAPVWLPLAWYVTLGCWVASRSADVQSLGIRPGVLRTAAVVGACAMVAGLGVGWAGFGRPAGIEIALLDVEPAAAFVRTPSGRTALLTTGASRQGLVASVGDQLDLLETAVDIVIEPGGVRAGVDLLDVGQERDDVERFPIEQGSRVEIADGVTIDVVDIRQVREQSALDLALRVDDLAVLLPGPGAPSPRWGEVAEDAITVGRLPAASVAWARALSPRRWLLLVGEPSLERVTGNSGVPFLARRDHGMIALTVAGGTLAVRAERCAGGHDCLIELPAPTLRALLPGPTNKGIASSEDADDPARGADDPDPDGDGLDEPTVQSGRAGDGR